MKLSQAKQVANELRKIQNIEERLCHFIYTPFTGLGRSKSGQGTPGYRGDDWFKYRIEIFKNYTLKSLLNQTNQFFIHWISFREEEQHNSQTAELFNYLQGLKYPTIFTFGGLCWWDDAYGKKDKLKKRLKGTLPCLREAVAGTQYVYETVLASDDMYHKDVVQSIHDQPFALNRALVHWNGYIYNTRTGELAEWLPKKGCLPPFYTLMFPTDVFLDYRKHFNYIKLIKSHENVETLFENIRLPDSRYCVNIHSHNISTRFEHPQRGGLVSPEVLKDFGI
jgi:hypothetical protein